MHHVYTDVMEMVSKNAVISKHPEKIEHILECCLDHLKECNSMEFEKILLKLHRVVYEGKMSESLAHHAVKSLEGNDPKHAKGPFWSFDEAEEIAKEHKIALAPDEVPAFYFVLNSMRADYFNPTLPEDEECYYVHLAKGFITDVDVANKTSKPFDYYYSIVKGY